MAMTNRIGKDLMDGLLDPGNRSIKWGRNSMQTNHFHVRHWLACGVTISLAWTSLTPAALAQEEPYFGNDAGLFSGDGQCDDPRFVGSGMSEDLLTDMIMRDATDCSEAFRNGSVSLNPMFATPASMTDIDYGDDTATFAKDGECDDIRFFHEGSGGAIYLVENIGHDATDCHALMASGKGRWQANDPDMELGDTGMDWLSE
jgi:hypothetical protein